MSDQRQAESDYTEGRVLCDAVAASCRCAKDFGHVEAGDSAHSCDPRECTGSWTGTYDQSRLDGGRDWQPLTFPRRITTPPDLRIEES